MEQTYEQYGERKNKLAFMDCYLLVGIAIEIRIG
jgi:hypothetical protein